MTPPKKIESAKADFAFIAADLSDGDHHAKSTREARRKEVQMRLRSFLRIVCFGASYSTVRAGEYAARFEIDGDIQSFLFERE